MERRWQVLLLISIGSFMAFLDAPVVSVAFPEIQESFDGSSPTTIAWVLDGYFIAFAAPLAVAGKLADRFGRRRLFVAGLWAFTLASLVCGIAPSAGFEIAGRVAQGVAAAMVVPAGQGLMLAEFPPGERKAAIGILSAVVGLASAIAPGVGGIVVDTMGWRWIFLLNVIVGIAALAWAASLLRRDEPARPGAPIPDLAGAALQGAGLALVVLAILKQSDWGTVDGRTVAALAIGVAALALFLRRSARHRAPVLDLELFQNRTFAMANLGGMIFGAGLFGSMIIAV
ncbi:MAG TPA: MFS transporter, partial [Solirubrobacteraceae bacterium]|nr:MFS transporter [Solirubrobacteraceae bacterium]